MKDKKKDLQREIEILENKIANISEKIKKIVLEIGTLHKELELNLNKNQLSKNTLF